MLPLSNQSRQFHYAKIIHYVSLFYHTFLLPITVQFGFLHLPPTAAARCSAGCSVAIRCQPVMRFKYSYSFSICNSPGITFSCCWGLVFFSPYVKFPYPSVWISYPEIQISHLDLQISFPELQIFNPEAWMSYPELWITYPEP